MALGAGLSTRATVKPQRRFRTKWVVPGGPFDSKTIYLPIKAAGTHDFTVDWGDGTTERVTNADSEGGTWVTNWLRFGVLPGSGWQHVYSSGGTYYVTITGKIDGWALNNDSNIQASFTQLAEVLEWGCLELGGGSALSKHFYPCPNMVWSATDRLELGDCTNLGWSFLGCTNLGSGGRVNLNTSAVTTFELMFYSCSTFNMDFCPEFSTESIAGGNSVGLYGFLGGATTGSFTKSFPDAFMAHTNRNTDFSFFLQAQASYNNPQISDLDTSSMTHGTKMFEDCTAFNQDISSWDVTSLVGSSNSFMEDCDNYSTANYDALLIAWNAQDLNTGVTMHFGDQTNYTGGGAAATARANLVDSGEHNWTITDGGTA